RLFTPVVSPVKIVEPLPPLVSNEAREYKNLLLRFSLVYPKDLTVREYDDGTSASTITFEDAREGKSFQIFVVPYKEEYITGEQFKKDIPSGIIEEATDIVIDGVRATVFFSKDNILGDTREVWFIKDGFLFEITTRRELDSWLAALMKSWRFDPYPDR
ncbi:MAG: hypothetical protein Greene041679_607, partial [Parcubacteria group bacterium Greene0416_79]